ncbi:double-strand break repair protein AddB [Paracoccus sp. DMF-8]|uniref:double-strand break repair protein AddB n=1 Tax=Paracoccus sp. DMF-8 TaxID=3019445 RepID=UPI0023E83EF8|nr:double-strand break repair protein AddB [Paracoccus sp. DMF-8]MDF3605193.1 double-strand break repair protein AddB [Paracoccus sp. DMF-8]
MAEWQPGLFALPCGADFAAGIAEGLIARMAGHPPEAMARVTVYANASRTLTALRDALIARGPMLLPRLRLVDHLGGGALVAPLARRLELGRLVAAALARQPDLAQGQSVPRLAASLADLMGEMQEEGLTPQSLDRIDVSEHAQHWGRALAFLKIAADYYLTDPPVDPAARLRHAVDRISADWAQGVNLPDGPVVVAGSTGSRGATRDFMRAVARLPMGAVILPGFDFHQPAPVWHSIDTRAEDHPQSRYAPLIAEFGQPARWVGDEPASLRNRLISLALRPAPVTDQWIADGPGLGDLIPATQGLTLIEADQPGQEAEAVALLIRDAAEKRQEVTLIAADRMLPRRVSAALDRWRIIPDDSAGQPLPLTPQGLFLSHVAGLVGQALTIDALVTLLKHPVTNTGSGAEQRRQHQIHTRDLELDLRRRGPAFPDGAALRDWGMKRGRSRKIWAGWLADVLDRAAPLALDRGPRPLADRLSELIDLAQLWAAGPGGDVQVSELWRGEAGPNVAASIAHIRDHAHLGHAMRPAEFCDLLQEEMQRQAVREDVIAHHLIHIRGPREARTENAPLVILAGLNEGGWPQGLAPDPWLSRPMRAAAGLTLPERRIGLSAHDFQQAVGRPHVVLTRARRDAEAETIPSRWLNRLTNLLGGLPDQNGKAALAQMRARGRHWLDLVALQATPSAVIPPAPRPSPIPPAPALSEMSVTDVARLIRDPYAVYARRVLGLSPLPPMRVEPDPAARGTVLHRIVQVFLGAKPSASDRPERLRQMLMGATDQVLEQDVPWPSARLFWRARIAGIADQLMADEAARLAAGSQPVVVENQGRVGVAGMDFTLTARPDRIDLLPDGRAQIYDYKSGKPPTDKQIALFDKQLPLEAAMVARGGFDAIGPVEAAGIAFIQLGGEGRTEDRAFDPAFAAETWDGFVALIGKYLRGERGFTARLTMEQTGHGSDYDHLSRLGEWSMTEPAVAQPLKGRDDG